MIIESIQRVYSVTPLYTEQRVYTTAVDPKTDKQYSEIVIYKIYNSQGQTEESYQPKVDLRA
jgi:hypothetical protein